MGRLYSEEEYDELKAELERVEGEFSRLRLFAAVRVTGVREGRPLTFTEEFERAEAEGFFERRGPW